LLDRGDNFDGIAMGSAAGVLMAALLTVPAVRGNARR